MGDAKAVLSRLKKGEGVGAILCLVEEEHLFSEFFRAARRIWLGEDGDLNWNRIDGKEQGAGGVGSLLRSIPFMGERRLVSVHRVEALGENEQESLIAAVGAIPEFSLLILVTSGLDKRKKLYKALSKQGEVLEFSRPENRDMESWARKALTVRGLSASAEVVTSLARRAGTDLGLLDSEIEKALTYLGGGNQITLEALDAVGVPPLEESVFVLLEGLAGQDPSTALRTYKDLRQRGEPALRIHAVILWQVRLLLSIYSARERGVTNPQDLAREVGASPYVVKRLLQGIGRFDESDLVRFLLACQEVEMDIKWGRQPEDLAMELLILRLAQK